MSASLRSWATSLRLARRDLRGGLKGFRLFLACLTLGVFTIAALGSVTEMLRAGIAGEGRAILGGDVEFALVQRRADEAERAYLADAGTVSEIATLRALASAPEAVTPALIEIKAIDDLYPLVGEATLADGSPLADALGERDGRRGVVVADTLLTRLSAEVGDLVTIGRAQLEIRGIVGTEPDRLGSGFVVGPRVFMTQETLETTELVQPGSLVRWRYRLDMGGAGASEAAVDALIERVRAELPDSGWRARSRANAAPGVQRFIDRLSFFMTLAGLTALIVGGVGIANAVRNYLETRTETIATFKCLGASGAAIFRIYLAQVLILAAFGTAIALVLGALLPVALVSALAGIVPVPVKLGLYPMPLLVAAAFGLLVTLAFTIWPLGRARDVPAAVLFRAIVAPVSRRPRAAYLAAIATALVLAAGLAFAWYDDTRITAFYVGGTFASFVLLMALAQGLMVFVRRYVRGRAPATRLAFRNIHRPGTPAPSIVLSLGLGLALVVTLALIDDNVSRELEANLPDRAPNFFFLDIQTDQLDTFRERVEAAAPGSDIDTVPMLRGRLMEIDGRDTADMDVPPEVRWVLRGDRGLTYSDALPDNSQLVAGEWWSPGYDGPPLVSFDTEIAEGLGVRVGTEITVNVLGRRLTATVANLRTVEWESLGINFVMIFSPNALNNAPHSHLATVMTAAQSEVPVLREVNAALPNVTAIRVKEALDAVRDLLEKLLAGIRGASAVSLFMSVLVLAGALASGYRARMYDAAILKSLGATRRTVLASHLAEYASYGLVTALFALVAGSIAAWAVLRFVMDLPWTFAPLVAVVTVVASVTLTVTLGLATSWRTLGAKPARVLRST